MLKTFLAFISLLTTFFAHGQTQDDLIGYWKSCDDDNFMVVEIKKNDNNQLVGELVGYHNPDGSWTERKTENRTIVMYNFVYQGHLKWKKGKIYDPKVKRTYRGVIELVNKNLLQATGYWGIFWDDIHFKRFKI
jgi:uncharacterized protein (DUF2147 family)